MAHHAALQQRSYLSALRSLHRFFDYNAGVLTRMLIPRLIMTPHGTIQLCTLSNYKERSGSEAYPLLELFIVCSMPYAMLGMARAVRRLAGHCIGRGLVAANQTRSDLVLSRTPS